ncbi:MAG: hypothetical protein PUC32_02595 [Oscillospiraceae bacterium]|nr:hypothetical protein [Oscillospiraceae bacterium]
MADEIKKMELNEEALKDVAGGTKYAVDAKGFKVPYYERGDWVMVWTNDGKYEMGVIIVCDRIEYTDKGDIRYYTVQTQTCGIVSGIPHWNIRLVHNVRDNKKD